ncbi:MAG: substrate-binding domain-containing protein [Kiritimatiellae bacterium]|nr:substrate-binding domain-containing protein [Kiritimatiellia bacterium]
MDSKKVLVMITPISYLRIGGVSRFAKDHGWVLTIHDRLGGLPPSTDYDGVLVTLRADEKTLAFIKRMTRQGIPAVDLTIQHPRLRLPRVVSDHRQIGVLAGEHFKERGFQSVAWFSTSWTHVHELRFEGLAESFGEAPQKWISDNDAQTAKTLSAAPKPTAVLAYDETDAVRLLHLCLAAGIDVPDDIAILSIGDDPLVTDNQPVPISCIRQNLSRGGYAAAALLDRLMNGGAVPTAPILVKPEGITVRRSTDTVADGNPLIRKVLLYIRDNLHRTFGAEQVAYALGESRSRLDKTCAARFGRSLGKVILEHRLAEVKRLLLKSDLNIDEIAARTGFCASNYLIKKFKSAFGTTPRRCRHGCRNVLHSPVIS